MDAKKIANYAAIALLMITAGMNVAVGKYDTALAIAALAIMVFLYNQKCEQLNAVIHVTETVMSKMLKDIEELEKKVKDNEKGNEKLNK